MKKELCVELVIYKNRDENAIDSIRIRDKPVYNARFEACAAK